MLKMLSSTLRLLVVIAALIHADAWKVFERWHQVQAAAAAAARRLPRALRETLDAKDGTGDYYDELLKITASYGGRMKKTEILPTWKYTRNFNLEPFEEW